MSKKTLVLGASVNPQRYSNMATLSLLKHGHPVVLLGLKAGEIKGEPILVSPPELHDIDTVTLYLNPNNQKPWYNYILSLRPKRIIFNPGTENPELFEQATRIGTECTEACTLVLLSIGAY
jgi:predicted CoA-binding protein